MRRAVLAAFAAVCLLMLAIPATAQTAPENPPTNQGSFSLTAQAVALPGGGQTVAGTLVGATYAITPRVSVRSDNLLAPANDFQGYFGGVQYFPDVTNLLAKTSLAPQAFQPYVTASVGVDRIVPASGSSQQHIALLLGGGINYRPSSGPVVNLIEVRWARLPGLATNTAVVSSGFSLNF